MLLFRITIRRLSTDLKVPHMKKSRFAVCLHLDLDLEMVYCSHHRNIIALQNDHFKRTSNINHRVNMTHYRFQGQQTVLIQIMFEQGIARLPEWVSSKI